MHLRFGTDKARQANQSEDYLLSASNTSRPRMPVLEPPGPKLFQPLPALAFLALTLGIVLCHGFFLWFASCALRASEHPLSNI